MTFLQSMRGCLLPIIATLVLSACAGSDFVRPTDDNLTLGKTTSAEAKAKFGNPRSTGEALKNEQKVQLYKYAYANIGDDAKYDGVTGARAMTLWFFNDLLIDREFVSSFASDVTDFDDSKITQIKKGSSTREDVIALLGKSSGEAIYPIIKSQTDRALIYQYVQVSGGAFNLKVFSKILIVSYDPSSNVVSDVDYTESGPKPVAKGN